MIFPSKDRFRLEQLLLPLLQSQALVSSSTMLRAYVTFASTVSYSEDFPLGMLKIDAAHPAFSDACTAFKDYSFDEFLRFIVPDLVGDPIRFLSFLRTNFMSDFSNHLPRICHTLIKVKLVAYRSDLISCDDDAIKNLYHAYIELEPSCHYRLDFDEFIAWYKQVNTIPLDTEELSLAPHLGYSEKKLYEGLFTLSRDLALPRIDQISAVADALCGTVTAANLANYYPPSNYAIEKNPAIRRRMFVDAFSKLLKVPALDLACALTVFKAGSTGTSKNESYQVPNDISLENVFVYNSFVSSLSSKDDSESILCIFPTPFFVRKCARDPFLSKKKLIFVFKDKCLCNLIKQHFENADSDSNLKFLSADDLWSNNVSQDVHVYSKVLFFAHGIMPSIQTKCFEYIKRHNPAHPIELYVLVSSHEFEKALSPFSFAGTDPQLEISKICLLPQGINNSSHPRRKILVQCNLYPAQVFHPQNSKVELYSYTLNTDLKTQSLSLRFGKDVSIDTDENIDLYSSVRKLYQDELLSRTAAGRTKTAPFSVEITPDIVAWCSKSYPKNNKMRPRLEVYVCKPADPLKVDRGFLDRGERISSTLKRVTRIEDKDVFHWLENEYPFSVLRPRRLNKDAETSSELLPIVSIRDEIIAEYTERLRGCNIALKTFWYLYPFLSDYFSGTDYQMLTHMAQHTEIGQVPVNDLSLELCDEWLPKLYPNESDSVLWHRVEILNLALTKAVELGHCANNRIAPILQSHKEHDKYFKQVRANLVKKHLEKDEMFRLHQFINDKLKDGLQPEYIGVLIRFLTGLESNIVCALTWNDILYLEDYDFSTFVITRQVTNNGAEYVYFDASEDYIRYPISALLQKRLIEWRTQAEKKIGKWARIDKIPIVTTLQTLADKNSCYTCYSPRKLELLCKEALGCIGLNDRIISLPTMDSGTKETNLNQYGGNFFRENIRFWLVNHCNMLNDEVMYLLRNKPSTTFGRYYYDFINDATQFLIYKALFRLDTLLEDLSPRGSYFEGGKRIRTAVITAVNDRSFPEEIHALATADRNLGEITFKISNSHGFRYYISILNT